MKTPSAAGTSAIRGTSSQAPPWVTARARELLDLASLRLLAMLLGANVALQILALSIALLAPPLLHYLPEAG